MVDEASQNHVDQVLRSWRQGDCMLGESWFLYRLNVDMPLTEEALAAAAEGADAGEAPVRGYMIATQTCDIVRSCRERPYIEVCPLIEVDAVKLAEIQRGRRPNYAYVPGVAEMHFVADLDRVMTVEKAVVASWSRVVGCRNDGEVRQISSALARKRARVAFPDDFVAFVANLQKRLSSKHDKNTEEGRALRALSEIRVRAAPSWDSDEVEITLWFIRKESEPTFENKPWDSHLESWLELIPASSRFRSIDGSVLTLDDLTAREYVESDPLDLDHLSTSAD